MRYTERVGGQYNQPYFLDFHGLSITFVIFKDTIAS